MPAAFHQACSRSEEHTSELQSHVNLVCRLLLEKKKKHLLAEYRPRCIIYVGTHPAPQFMIPQQLAESSLERLYVSHLHHFFFIATATTEIYTLSLHDALPI